MRRIFPRLGRGLLAASTTLAGLQAASVQAQYGGYPQAQPQYTPPGAYTAYQPPHTYGQPSPNYAQPQQQQPQGYARAPQQTAVQAPQTYAQPGFAPTQPYVPSQTTPTTPGFAQTPPYAPYGVPHVARAFQNNAPATDNLPLNPPAESVAPGVANGGNLQPTPSPENYNPAVQSQPYPAPSQGYAGYPAPGAGGADCNCAPNAYTQAAAAPYEGYPVSGGCDGYGCAPSGGKFHKLFSGYRAPGCGYWFGGVYGLYMDRDNSDKYTLAYVTDPSMPSAYPPSGMNPVMTTRDVDTGFQPGVEFRLGRAFGGGADPCGGCCGPNWGLEGVYWTLFEDDDSTYYNNPSGTSRTYSMMPMYGLEYAGGIGTMPVNEYWDYGAPSMPANDIRISQVRVSSGFEVQNLELNLLRLNVCGGGCGPGGYGGGYGPGLGGFGGGGYGGCDTCASCAPCAPRYSCTAVCGVRWMQFDEDFMFGVDWYDSTMPSDRGFLDYRSEVENNLVGFQLGCNGMYRIGCKWGVHVNTLAGIYGNDIDVHQYMVSPTGDVRFIGTGENFNAYASKTDVAMLGELRLGASYQATCRCRLYGGWRVIGISGLALATDQTPNAFVSSAQMSNYVNSNGSMILHGLQTGVEWNY
jgi:hypothetical protein